MEGNTVLIAVYPILYHSHQYKVGEELPVNDPDMVSAWLEAGTASYISSEEKDTDKAVKATPVTAEAGLSGNAVSSESDGEDLVGKIPKTAARTKKANSKKA